MKLTEEIMAERFHKLGLGIYDENGTYGNIYLDNIPDIIPKDTEEIICIYQSGSFEREIKDVGGAIHPIIMVYVKGRNLIKTAKKAKEICDVISEDQYISNDFIVHQTYIFSEPTRLAMDEKENYTFSFRLLLTIEEKKS